MSDNIMETGSSADRNRCIIEKIITIPGLNLLITPDKQYESCSVLSISLSIADVTGFLDKESGHGRVLVFSLEDTKKRAEHMLDQYSAMLGNITVIYAYQPGTFGNKIEEGLDVFLKDNPQLKFIVIDSIEKIVEGETDQMKYDFAYNKLCALKEVASKHGVTLLVSTYIGDPENIDKFADVADTVLKVIENSSQNGEEYTLCISGKNISRTKVSVGFDAGRCRWNWVTAR